MRRVTIQDVPQRPNRESKNAARLTLRIDVQRLLARRRMRPDHGMHARNWLAPHHASPPPAILRLLVPRVQRRQAVQALLELRRETSIRLALVGEERVAAGCRA